MQRRMHSSASFEGIQTTVHAGTHGYESIQIQNVVID